MAKKKLTKESEYLGAADMLNWAKSSGYVDVPTGTTVSREVAARRLPNKVQARKNDREASAHDVHLTGANLAARWGSPMRYLPNSNLGRQFS